MLRTPGFRNGVAPHYPHLNKAQVSSHPPQSAEILAAMVNRYLDEHPLAGVKQSGVLLFSMKDASYTAAAMHGRCSLFIWSESLSKRRTVVAAQEIKGCMRLTLARLGTKTKEIFWLTPDEVSHPLSSKQSTRIQYAELLKKVICLDALDSVDALLACPLKRRSGPLTASCNGPLVRGMVKRGTEHWAFVGAGRHETHDCLKSLLACGISWLSRCRASARGGFVAGVMVICPAGRTSLIQQRVAWLKTGLSVKLYELDEEEERLTQIPCGREISCSPDIRQAFHQEAAKARSSKALAKLASLLPPQAMNLLDVEPLSPTRLSVQLNGLECATVRYGVIAGSFERRADLYCRSGHKSVLLTGTDREARFRLDMALMLKERNADGLRTSLLYRARPNVWLTKQIRASIFALMPEVNPQAVQGFVESSSCGIKDVIHLLAVSGSGRLIIIHVRADGKLIFPMHGLDQWIRVRELNQSGALKAAGYFPGITVSEQSPKIVFITPALRLEEESEALLRYFSSEIDWAFIGVDENWRRVPRAIYHKSHVHRETA